MGACYLYGQTGGGGEKIKALSGTIAPETAQENALWVQTKTPVTDYVFSPVQPDSPAEGTVWFHTIGEGVNFILDKKQKLRFHLEAAYQYVGGAWRSVDVSVYAGTGWEQIVSNRIYFYNKGVQCTDLTGGWAVKNHETGNGVLKEAYISVGPDPGTSFGSSQNISNIHTNNKVYIPDGYTKLCARVNLTGNASSFKFGLGTGLVLQGGGYKAYTELPSGTVGEYTVEVDVAEYVYQSVANIVFYATKCEGQITEVWLER